MRAEPGEPDGEEAQLGYQVRDEPGPAISKLPPPPGRNLAADGDGPPAYRRYPRCSVSRGISSTKLQGR